jgi:hypothetical protein
MKLIARLMSSGALVISAGTLSSLQDLASQSAMPASKLAHLMAARKLEAVAARDADRPNRFVAALYYPGAQFLVLSAEYPAPDQLLQRLNGREFRDAYMDLQGAGAREGKVFITDLRADGLRRTRETNGPFDIVYRDGIQYMAYDGNWSGQKVTEKQYNERFDEDDAQYAHMLRVLIADVQQPAGAQTIPRP